MTMMRWGRLRVDMDLRLRRGAWYRVREVGSLEAVLEVNRTPLPLPRALLQIIEKPPQKWTVVDRPANAIRIPPSWKRYGVCPNCRERVALERKPPTLDCPRCDRSFEVGWDETYRLES